MIMKLSAIIVLVDIAFTYPQLMLTKLGVVHARDSPSTSIVCPQANLILRIYKSTGITPKINHSHIVAFTC